MTAGQRRGQLLEPVDPRHLLDHVRLAADIAAPERWRLDVEAIGRVERVELERLQDLLAPLARNR